MQNKTADSWQKTAENINWREEDSRYIIGIYAGCQAAVQKG